MSEPVTESAVSPVAALADEFVDRMHRANPFDASLLGLTEYDAFVPDASAAAEAELTADLRDIQARTDALTAPADSNDRLVLAVLQSQLHTTLLGLQSRAVEHTVTAMPLSGPPELFQIAAQSVLPTPRSGADYLARLRASGGWIDTIIDRLRTGAAGGRVPVAALAQGAVGWADAALEPAVPAAITSPAAAVEWEDADEFRAELERIGADVVRPALERWRDVVRDELLPIARPDERAGISALPGGAEDYLRAIEIHTTLPLTATELHEIGLHRIAELEAQAVELGAMIGLADLAEVREAFRINRSADPDASMEQARTAIRAAEARVGDVFAPPVAPPCAVSAMPDTVADTGMAPHYTLPRADGSRPGTYWFNTRTATVGTGWDLEAVAFHEAVPGHHTQLARAQMTEGLPRLVTQSLITVHAEGWGLYAERLAGEMGLYSSIEQQIGSVFMELHRAARLVVDTGLHAFGWSRQQALDFLVEHMPVPLTFLSAEIDRYIAWPGQALAYLTGQREILRLRDEAHAARGGAFDLRGFHGAVLDHGSLPMPALETVVNDWIAAA